MISFEFILTSLLLVLLPGAGVLYIVASGLFIGRKASLFAAVGCTFSIIPALLASSLGLAALFHTSVLAFQIVKYAGSVYLIYLAWKMWHASSPISLNEEQSKSRYVIIMLKGFLMNVLNPKLSLVFLAFFPQFIPIGTDDAFTLIFIHGAVFMMMSFLAFVFYGLLSAQFSELITKSKKLSTGIQKNFSASFAALGLKLALSDRT